MIPAIRSGPYFTKMTSRKVPPRINLSKIIVPTEVRRRPIQIKTLSHNSLSLFCIRRLTYFKQPDHSLHEILRFESCDKISRLKIQLSYGLNVNKKDAEGHSLLYYALTCPSNNQLRYEIVTLLFQHGANIDSSEYYKGSACLNAIYYADSYEGKIGALQALLENGERANQKDLEGRSLLSYAITQDNEVRYGILKTLFAYGAMIDRDEFNNMEVEEALNCFKQGGQVLWPRGPLMKLLLAKWQFQNPSYYYMDMNDYKLFLTDLLHDRI